MSNPAVRARRAAATHSSCTRRMSAASITLGTVTPSQSLAICDGASGGSRDSRCSAKRPPCHSSTPASASFAWAASAMSESARMSSSSQSRAEV